jgi:hypothetical protein
MDDILKDPTSRYISVYSQSDFQHQLREYRLGKLQNCHCSGFICMVIKGKQGTVFTIKNKKYRFLYLGDLDIQINDKVDFNVIYSDGFDDLYVLNFNKPSGFPGGVVESDTNNSMHLTEDHIITSINSFGPLGIFSLLANMTINKNF